MTGPIRARDADARQPAARGPGPIHGAPGRRATLDAHTDELPAISADLVPTLAAPLPAAPDGGAWAGASPPSAAHVPARDVAPDADERDADAARARTALAMDLFTEALDQPDDAREGWVIAQTLGDAALREEVLSLLRADARREGRFLERPIAQVASALLRGDSSGGGQLGPGSRLGPYILERRLAGTDAGAVYLARDARDGEEVAVKTIAVTRAGPTTHRRFLREMDIVRTLHHPHVLPLRDAGEDERRVWFAMRYVAGESLRKRLHGGETLPLDDALRIAEELAGALAHAHEHRVVHRDVKPANVLLDAGGRALLTDFGIARVRDAAPLTGAGYLVGTPGYMSPEQLRGEAVDERADLYALGCVLHEMLVGATPWSPPRRQPDDPPARPGLAHELAMRAQRELPPPVGLVRPEVPARVEALLAWVLQPRPADRLGDAAVFAREVAAVRAALAAGAPATTTDLGVPASTMRAPTRLPTEASEAPTLEVPRPASSRTAAALVALVSLVVAGAALLALALRG